MGNIVLVLIAPRHPCDLSGSRLSSGHAARNVLEVPSTQRPKPHSIISTLLATHPIGNRFHYFSCRNLANVEYNHCLTPIFPVEFRNSPWEFRRKLAVVFNKYEFYLTEIWIGVLNLTLPGAFQSKKMICTFTILPLWYSCRLVNFLKPAWPCFHGSLVKYF